MGVAVLADVNSTSRYWHFYEAPGGAPPPDTTAPDTTITSGPPSTTIGDDGKLRVLLQRDRVDVPVQSGRSGVRVVHLAHVVQRAG